MLMVDVVWTESVAANTVKTKTNLQAAVSIAHMTSENPHKATCSKEEPLYHSVGNVTHVALV